MRYYCNEHPKQEVVGVCPLCLSHRLRLVLADNTRRSSKFRLFAFPTSLFYRPSRHLLSNSTSTSTSSLPGSDDSYISIKFGDNGEPSWDKSGSRVSTMSQQQQQQQQQRQQQQQQNGCSAKVNKTTNKKIINSKSVVEHVKPRPVSLRLRNRIAQLLQIIRWNRPGNSQVQTVKMRNRRARVRTLNINSMD